MKQLIIFGTIVCLLFPGATSAQGQERKVKGYNEISTSLGLGGIQGGIAGPYVSAFYTRGLQFGEYFDAGLSVGYELGFSAHVTLRAKLPFGEPLRSGLYLSGNAGASFFNEYGTIPILTGSSGLFWRFKNRTCLYTGPFYTRFYTVSDAGLGEASGHKGWGSALGLHIGFQF